jgi:hypothetical protein
MALLFLAHLGFIGAVEGLLLHLLDVTHAPQVGPAQLLQQPSRGAARHGAQGGGICELRTLWLLDRQQPQAGGARVVERRRYAGRWCAGGVRKQRTPCGVAGAVNGVCWCGTHSCCLSLAHSSAGSCIQAGCVMWRWTAGCSGSGTAAGHALRDGGHRPTGCRHLLLHCSEGNLLRPDDPPYLNQVRQ